MKSLVVWYKPKSNVYYYKVVYNFFDKYYPGYTNSYGHVVILVINIYKELIHKDSMFKMVLSHFIGFLQKIYRKL